MKRRISTILLAATLAVGWTAACDKEKPPEVAEESAPAKTPTTGAESAPMDHGEHGDHAHHETLPAAEIPEGASIYQIEPELEAQDGKSRTWDDFRGQPLLVSMVYTSCTTACPLIVAEIQQILEQANAPRHRVLLVSMDPERDDPAALAEMAKRHELGENWTLARADADGVQEVAAVLGVRYRQLPSKDFNHSQVIAYVDENGVIQARTEGLGPQRSAVVEKIRADAAK